MCVIYRVAVEAGVRLLMSDHRSMGWWATFILGSFKLIAVINTEIHMVLLNLWQVVVSNQTPVHAFVSSEAAQVHYSLRRCSVTF